MEEAKRLMANLQNSTSHQKHLKKDKQKNHNVTIVYDKYRFYRSIFIPKIGFLFVSLPPGPEIKYRVSHIHARLLFSVGFLSGVRGLSHHYWILFCPAQIFLNQSLILVNIWQGCEHGFRIGFENPIGKRVLVFSEQSVLHYLGSICAPNLRNFCWYSQNWAKMCRFIILRNSVLVHARSTKACSNLH